MKVANQFALQTLRQFGLGDTPTDTLRNHLTKRWRSAILEGNLSPGCSFPSTRMLAKELGIGRSTVVKVIEQLALEGYLITRPRGSTEVAKLPTLQGSQRGAVAQIEVSLASWQLDDPPSPIKHRAFRPGLPDLSSLSSSAWGSHLARRARRPISHDLSYAHATGIPMLQEAPLMHLRQTRGLNAEANQVIIVPSAQAAFDIATRLVIRPGDVAWVEDPGYLGIRTVLRGAGARLVPCHVDPEGLEPRVDSDNPKLIYLTPSHQYPTGVAMSLQRRIQILKLAERVGSLIIEDDYDTEYQTDGQLIASLQGMDGAQCVAYVGTFSKTMAPGVRAAFLVIPKKFTTLAHTISMACGQLVSIHIQLALADYLNDGSFQRHIKKLSHEARQRMSLLICKLREIGDPRISVPEPTGSLQVCIGWSGMISDVELVSRMQMHSLTAVPISTLCSNAGYHGLLLGVGLVQVSEVGPMVAKFASCLNEVL